MRTVEQQMQQDTGKRVSVIDCEIRCGVTDRRQELGLLSHSQYPQMNVLVAADI